MASFGLPIARFEAALSGYVIENLAVAAAAHESENADYVVDRLCIVAIFG
jgi:hypothetical protein